jgi:hypothetical protein
MRMLLASITPRGISLSDYRCLPPHLAPLSSGA